MVRKSANQMADEFECRVRDLLKTMGFSDVGGGRDSELGIQVDACGGFEDSLIIVECKSTQKDKKPLLDAIRTTRGVMKQIEEAVKNHPTYCKYSRVVFAIATNFEIRETDEEEALNDPKVFLWDRAFVDYYEELISRIGEYSKFNLLGELECTPRISSIITVPAFRINTGGLKLFMFMYNPKEILRFSYVARREIGREKYYQRIVESGRLRSIASYVDSGRYFPNAAIIAFGVSPKFTPFKEVESSIPNWSKNVEFGCLSFPVTYRSCWIVDGQHRLYGMSKTAQLDPSMPIVAIDGATLESQAQLFLDINKNQKQVPSDLVWDLEGEMRPNSPDGIVSRVVKELNKTGVLAGRIYVPLQGLKRQKPLKLTSLCAVIRKRKLTGQILEHKYANPLYDKDPNRTVSTVSGRLNEAIDVLDDIMEDWQKDQFWYTNNGLVIFIALFERILENCAKVPNQDDYRKYFGPVKGHMERYRDSERIKSLRVRCSSEGGRDDVIAEFVRAIRRQTGEKNFAKDIPEFELEGRIKKVERGLGNLMDKVLSVTNKNWFKDRVAHQIRERVIGTREKDKPNSGPIQDYFTLGEIAETVKRSDNWKDLEKAFQRGGFSSLEEVSIAFTTVNRLRGLLVHGRSNISEPDEMLLDGYLKKSEKTIELALEENDESQESGGESAS
jgi:DGQHR domain-containing protein